ncbi:hypothetical protein [uncultured Serinicoccus sp.]|uniref:hypothetical protein n=1 Tax=uncultured Serinicoccus sp. TaxID=735514 RepID=UPI00260AED0B|nr:hypothetical protein [uncultured Serinicoccus sp.]
MTCAVRGTECDPTSGALLRQVPDEDTAPIVREMYPHVLEGDGCATISKDLTRRDVTPPAAADLPHVAGAAVAVHHRPPYRHLPTYAARRVHQGQVVGDADWPPLVDVDTWEWAVAVIRDPARNTRTGDSTATHLLTGIATCGVCGTPVHRIKNRGIHSQGW